MPAPVVAAVGNYLQAGGNVVLFGATQLPPSWHAIAGKKVEGGVEHECGFGRCFALSSTDVGGANAATIGRLRDTASASLRYWTALPADSGAANSLLPVIENLRIPVRGIVLFMLLFIIVIGPLNIFLLKRKNRRTWMLWTIPAISFATTLIVFAYSLLREGVSPETRVTGLTFLDQATHHAATIGATGFYCPLTPSGGLRFESHTEATPLVQSGYGSGAQREVNWSQMQHLGRGWVASRVPAHFHLRKSETRRERIQIVNENGKMQVVNGLGTPIKSLWVAAPDTGFYVASNIPAGQMALLSAAKNAQGAGKFGVAGLLRDVGFTASTNYLDPDASKYLKPGTYIAVLDGNPFIENALGLPAGAKRTKASAVVYGVLDPEEQTLGAK
jgi:hypothetical protein